MKAISRDARTFLQSQEIKSYQFQVLRVPRDSVVVFVAELFCELFGHKNSEIAFFAQTYPATGWIDGSSKRFV